MKKGNISPPIQNNISVKITGIVFWGMVLLGLLFSFFLLQDEEKRISKDHHKSSLLIAKTIEALFAVKQSSGNNPIIVTANISEEMNQLKALTSFQGIIIRSGNKEVEYGYWKKESEKYSYTLFPKTNHETELHVYFADIREQINDRRKSLILLIGFVVVSFGFLLQKVLQQILTVPFLKMVDIAQRFANGNSHVRFNESREDEFGFLGKFINKALNEIFRNQQELEITLDWAQKSEQELYREKEKIEVTLSSITDSVITANSRGMIQYLNPAAERLLGVASPDLLDKNIEDAVHIIEENTGRRLKNPFYDSLKTKSVQILAGQAAIMRQDTNTISIEITAAPMKNYQGDVIGGVLVIQDVSNTRKLTHQLKHQACHDSLTGLYNRRMFEEKLGELLSEPEEGQIHHLLYMDLDQFKIVNDTSGHMAGDELLRQLSKELYGSIRKGDVLARLGGDEFGVLLENCSLDNAIETAEKLRNTIRNYKFVWQGKPFEIGSSIGIVSITSANRNFSSIMSSADLACYAAKESGRNRIHWYQEKDEALSRRHGEMHWATTVSNALKHNLLVLYRQPILNIHSSETETDHWEILIRMKGENGEVFSPNLFLPAAERYNLLPEIDRWVINNIFKMLQNPDCCKTAGLKDRVIAINLSGSSMGDQDLLKFIRDTANKYKTNLHEICFEITETVAISNLGRATNFINELKSLGCRFALDDFGSGLSSFEYLKTLPVDYLKIDGSFVKDMKVDAIDRAMVEAITRIGHIMNIQTIAEWVGDKDTLRLLERTGVDFVQGHFIGRPEPVTMGKS